MPFFFANQLLLWGLVAVSVPILIHLLMRQRPKPRTWGAMRWLLAALEVAQRRYKLTNLLLLLLRCLIITILALALARPSIRGFGGGGRLVLVVDTTASMGAVGEGVGALEDCRDKLQAFATVTLDGCFVVRDLKIIDGNNGLFVAMPSRKLTDRCGKCGTKNHLRASFCNDCGAKIKHRELAVDDQGRPKLHVDVAHPINSKCREYLQTKVLDEFEKEMVRAKGAGPDVIKADAQPKLDAAPADEGSEQKPAAQNSESKKDGDGKREFGMGIFS